jgi:4-diphosphocytidyl-2-C-methyl-D-erythritol kinase
VKAPAKINLTLLLGPTRDSDGRHELVTVFEPLELHDTIHVERAPADEVVCPGVTGDNLAAQALRAFRAATGWDGPGLRLTIEKRIPVAGGMAGGSADAAAALRIAARESGLGDPQLLHELAFGLGADVPSQLAPRRLLGTGAGEHLEELPPADEPYGVLVLPHAEPLSTGAVFDEADRLGLARDLDGAADAVRRGEHRFVNDLAPAAISLLPSIEEALQAAREAGAHTAMVSGSGPTVLGFFDAPEDAERAAAGLSGRAPKPIATRSFVRMSAGS